MQTAEYNHEDFSSNSQSEADKTLLVKFYIKSLPDKEATAKEARPMFKDVEMVDIKVPGQRDGVARPATYRDKTRFPRHYEAFKARVELPAEGTPLAEWPAISRSMADQLSFINIKTVEQLADFHDSSMTGVPGAQTLKQKAKDWLEATKDDAILAQLRDELTARDTIIEGQEKNIKILMKRLEKLEAAADEE